MICRTAHRWWSQNLSYLKIHVGLTTSCLLLRSKSALSNLPPPKVWMNIPQGFILTLAVAATAALGLSLAGINVVIGLAVIVALNVSKSWKVLNDAFRMFFFQEHLITVDKNEPIISQVTIRFAREEERRLAGAEHDRTKCWTNPHAHCDARMGIVCNCEQSCWVENI